MSEMQKSRSKSMEEPNRRYSGSTKKRTADLLDLFPMTQDESADLVSWELEKDKSGHASPSQPSRSTRSQQSQSLANVNWRSLVSGAGSKRQRLSLSQQHNSKTEVNMEMDDDDPRLDFLMVEAVNNKGKENNIPVPPIHNSQSRPVSEVQLSMMIVKQQPSRTIIAPEEPPLVESVAAAAADTTREMMEEELDLFEISEEDLARIDEDVNRCLSSQQQQATTTAAAVATAATNHHHHHHHYPHHQQHVEFVVPQLPAHFQPQQSLAAAAVPSNIDIISISDEELAALEAAEEEAFFRVATTNAATAAAAAAAAAAATTVQQPQPSSSGTIAAYAMLPQGQQQQQHRLLWRLRVETIINDPHVPIKIITASLLPADDSNHHVQQQVTVELLEDWYYHSEMIEGDIFHLLDLDWDNKAQGRQSIVICFHPLRLRLTNSHGLLVSSPQVMIAPTRIADAIACSRRGVIGDRMKAFGHTVEGAVMGKLRHCFLEDLTEKVLQILPTLINNKNNSNNRKTDVSLVCQHLPQQEIRQMMQRAANANLEELFMVGKGDQDIIHDLDGLVEPAVDWLLCLYRDGVYSYLNKEKGIHAVRDYDHRVNHAAFDQKARTIVSVEESILSPWLGIKGQVDLIAGSSLISPPPAMNSQQQGSVGQLMMPIELKTGRWTQSSSNAHRAQVILYLLLLRLRDAQEPLPSSFSSSSSSISSISEYGLLLYIYPKNKDNNKDKRRKEEMEVKVDLIQPFWSEIRHLVMARNSLARDMLRVVEQRLLPAGVKQEYTCSGCFQAAECMLYRAAWDNNKAAAVIDDAGGSVATKTAAATITSESMAMAADSSGAAPLFNYILQGITPVHLAYFQHWDQLLDHEQTASANNVSSNNSSELWMISGHERSKAAAGAAAGASGNSNSSNSNNNNKCIAGLMFMLNVPFVNNETAGDGGIMFTLRRPAAATATATSNTSNTEMMVMDVLTVGDRVIVSLERSYPNYQLQPAICSANIIEITADLIKVSTALGSNNLQRMNKAVLASWTVRLDKDEGNNVNIATMRASLMDLFVQPFDQKMYKVLTKPAAAAKNNQHEVDEKEVQRKLLSDERRKHLRELIIDLKPPRFTALNLLHPEVKNNNKQQLLHLCRPIAMSSADYEKDIHSFHRYVYCLQHRHQAPPPANVRAGLYNELILPSGVLSIYPGCIPTELEAEYRVLNNGQQQAVQRVLMTQDYSLLWGLPGSGKTNTLCLIIRMLVARGETVLLTSYTHNAVDHLLGKLVEKGMRSPQLLRLGNVSAIGEKHQQLAVVHACNGSVDQLQRRVDGVRVFACTVLNAAKSSVLKKIHSLDWCVMDEAGQMTQPAALGGILRCRKFLLAGDDRQLPPLVQSNTAREQGMDISLFQRLKEAHPQAMSSLTAQYRMNDTIMALCSELVYDRKMAAGSLAVAHARLLLPGFDRLPLPRGAKPSAVAVPPLKKGKEPQLARRYDWLSVAIDPLAPVVFINTDDHQPPQPQHMLSEVKIHRPSSSSGNGNDHEAAIVQAILSAFHICAVPPETEIAVITPFRAQVATIQRRLNNDPAFKGRRIAVSTVDKYQGQDKDVIIFSTMKSSMLCNILGAAEMAGEAELKDGIGYLLRDWRRINVALTRAKLKLIIVGSAAMMQAVPILQKLVEYCHRNRQIVSVPSRLAASEVYPPLIVPPPAVAATVTNTAPTVIAVVPSSSSSTVALSQAQQAKYRQLESSNKLMQTQSQMTSHTSSR